MSLVELTISDAEFVANEFVHEFFSHNVEPIPAFSTRLPNRLESVLMSPFASFGAHEVYPTLEEKAAALFYATCKDHPFQNGNKRMAVVLTLVFLYLNGYFLDVSPTSLYDRALAVTASTPSEHDAVIRELADYILRGWTPRDQVEPYIAEYVGPLPDAA